MDCIFCNIATGKIGTLIYEDKDMVAFNDIDPKAPIHVLIVPKKHIPTINDLTEKENTLIGQMIQTAKHIAEEKDIAEKGYRLLFNCNRGGGQAVFHIHLHLLGGRQ